MASGADIARSLLVVGLLLVGAASAGAQTRIADIQAEPSRYKDLTVTLSGRVVGVTADPVGSTRGTYSLLDASSAEPIVVATEELPPLGVTYVLTAVVSLGSGQTEPSLSEVDRTEPGMPKALRYGLLAAAAVLLILLVALLSMLVGPKDRRARKRQVIFGGGPTLTPPPATRTPDTTEPNPAPASTHEPAKTRLYVHLGVELAVEHGPDRNKIFPLHQHLTTIGRAGSRQNDVVLTDDTVSKEQASIRYDPKSKVFTITNESSTNPTIVNQSVVSSEQALDDDSRIEMGGTTLHFRSV